MVQEKMGDFALDHLQMTPYEVVLYFHPTLLSSDPEMLEGLAKEVTFFRTEYGKNIETDLKRLNNLNAHTVGSDSDTLPEGIQISEEPSSGSDGKYSTGYVRAIVFMGSGSAYTQMSDDGSSIEYISEDDAFGDISDDVISITTDQGSSSQESDSVAKMTVTLNNNNQKYSKKFTPHVTLAYSWIKVERNIIKGDSVTVSQELYPLFFGRVNEVNLTVDQCVVSCGDEGGQLTSSPTVDLTWYPNVNLKDRVQKIVDSIGDGVVDLDIVVADEDSTTTQIQTYAPANEPANGLITMECKSFGTDWVCPSDMPHTLLIKDSNYYTDEELDISDFVVDPGDNESIVGYCNHVRVFGDSPDDPTSTAMNIISSDHMIMSGEYTDEEGVSKYGLIEAPSYRFPNLTTKEQCDAMAQSIVDVYKTYIDRLVKIKICDRIPKLLSYVYWNIYDNANGDNKHTIHAYVMRKCVTYDTANGVIVDLECKRRDMTAGTGSTSSDNLDPTFIYRNDVTDDHGAKLDLRMKIIPESDGTHLFEYRADGQDTWSKANTDMSSWAKSQYDDMLPEAEAEYNNMNQ